MSKFRATIDRDECISCGSCWDDCPEFFEEGDDGLSQVVDEFRVGDNLGEGEASEELIDCVRDAASDCPLEIIHIWEVGD